jgi:hypothetical protein
MGPFNPQTGGDEPVSDPPSDRLEVLGPASRPKCLGSGPASLDCGSALIAALLPAVPVFRFQCPNKCQESAVFNGVFPGKDLGNTRLCNPESSRQILLRATTHRFPEVP